MWASSTSGKSLFMPLFRLPLCCLHQLLKTASRSPNVAPPIGPILGGVLAARLGWEWIFWFLCIMGGLCLILILFTLPETARCLVGDGSIPARGINRTLWSILTQCAQPQRRIEVEDKPTARIPNPFSSLKLLLLKDVAIIIVCNGVYYATYCSIQASLSTLFIDIYNYQELQAGLIYIPFGLACLVSALTWGLYFHLPASGCD